MGVQVHNICYSDNAQALLAIQSDFPIFTASTSSAVYLNTSSLDQVTGIFNYSTKDGAGATLATGQTVAYPLCSDNDANLNNQLPDVVFIVGVVVLFALGFIAGKTR